MTRKVDGRFPYPLVVDPPRKGVCIQLPLDENHARAFFAAINELAMPFAWEWVGQASGNAAALVWKEIVYDAALQYYSENDCMGCNDCFDALIKIVTDIDTYIDITYNDYDTYVSGGGTSVGPMTTVGVVEKGGSNNAEIEAMICWAAHVMVDMMCEALKTKRTSWWKDALGKLGDAIVAANKVLAEVFGWIPGAVSDGIALGTWIGSKIAAINDGLVTDEVYAALNDQQARDQLACCIGEYLNVATTVATWVRWQGTGICSSVQSPSCCDLTDNGKILQAIWRQYFATDVNAYIDFFMWLERANYLSRAGFTPFCNCSVCDDYTVFHDETDSFNYTLWTPPADQNLEQSGVFYGVWLDKAAKYNFGENICLNSFGFFWHRTSEPVKIFLQFDDGTILQRNDERGGSTFNDNDFTFGPIVTRTIKVWAQTRPGESDDPDQNPYLGATADARFARIGTLTYYAKT